jgi:hypothetical protein
MSREREREYGVVGPRNEVQLAHDRLHQLLPRAGQLAVAARLGRPHIAVGQQARVSEALGRDALVDGSRWLALVLAAHLRLDDTRHIHKHAVQYRTLLDVSALIVDISTTSLSF